MAIRRIKRIRVDEFTEIYEKEGSCKINSKKRPLAHCRR